MAFSLRAGRNGYNGSVVLQQARPAAGFLSFSYFFVFFCANYCLPLDLVTGYYQV